MSCHESTQALKFADNGTVLGLITNSEASAYHGQVNKPISWCSETSLEFNVDKRKHMIVGFRRNKSSPLSPRLIDGNISHF